MGIAVITGACQGLGLETARELATAGHHAIVTGRKEKAVKQAIETIILG